MNTIKTDIENIFRDPNSKCLSIINNDELNKIKHQRSIINRINKLEESVNQLNNKLDVVLNTLRNQNEPRIY